jgi:hypothetical protein
MFSPSNIDEYVASNLSLVAAAAAAAFSFPSLFPSFPPRSYAFSLRWLQAQ